ncbi:hypothetical protein WISP_142594 [Willisornis vidua]|uniref:Uncharacterized protein n=1 Tax=Willisornis vidua TaxID=1566151 RepID=A0ABQ9CPA8_9PASS|nr:hypothetical protein WISP_142594 [Willisornis vidua]
MGESKVLWEPTHKDALPGLLLASRVDLTSKVEIGGCLDHSNYDLMEFKISVNRSKSAMKTLILDMRRADFRLLRDLVIDGTRGFQCPELVDCDCKNDHLPVSPAIVQDLLLQLDAHKSIGPDGIYPRIFKEVDDVNAHPSQILLEQMSSTQLDKHILWLGNELVDSSPVKKDLEKLVDEKLYMTQQCALTVQMASCILGSIKSSVTSRVREGILLLCSALVGLHLECCTQLWDPQHRKDMDLLE